MSKIALIWRITLPLLRASMRRITSAPEMPTSRPMAAKGSRSSGNSRWIKLRMSLSMPSIMRLPETVLTTLYIALLDGLLLHDGNDNRRNQNPV